jgi:uncharacterized protein (DUF1778 family)
MADGSVRKWRRENRCSVTRQSGLSLLRREAGRRTRSATGAHSPGFNPRAVFLHVAQLWPNLSLSRNMPNASRKPFKGNRARPARGNAGGCRREGRAVLQPTRDQRSLLVAAAARDNADVAEFILGCALHEERRTIVRTDRIVLSRRDCIRVLDLLENPPAPTASLMRSAAEYRVRARHNRWGPLQSWQRPRKVR